MLDTSIEYLKGVGPKRAELLKTEINIHTFHDLLQYFPFRYVDRSVFHKVADIESDAAYVQVKGRIGKVEKVGKPRQQRLVAQFYDESGSIELVWFKGIRFIQPMLKPNVDFVLFGKPNIFKGRKSIAHPELEKLDEKEQKAGGALQPVYSTTEKLSGKGLNSRGIEKLQKSLQTHINRVTPETLNEDIGKRLSLMSLEESYRQIHFPSSTHELDKARFRLKFEELFFTQLQLIRMQIKHKKNYKGFVFEKVGTLFNQFYQEHLPFELTNAQKRVIKEIRKDLGSGEHMNRLLQGDVGSGKTIVAILCMLLAIDNGFQACLMAPTEILANQHYQGIAELLKPLGLEVRLLTGSSKTAERRELHEMADDGSLPILIGTHALLEEKVQFKNLGLAIIDEQHRFGVAQRARLWKKNVQPPHVLVMTATPIPRTLAMTFYGDLDTSVIDELPPGRKAIKTIHRGDSSRAAVFGFLKQEIDKGLQVYVVYPLIEESEKMDYKDLMDGYESIRRAFPPPSYQVSVVHGKQKAADKDFEMSRFANGETHILVATTVIEVGVNVPNASVMVIESAERFGLSQLHQLRGRVGRGAEQSYCILMTGHKLSNEGKTRMKTMCGTNDGFEVAEVDLRLRGPGDMMGTRQSGVLNFLLADLAKDGDLVKLARAEARHVLKGDPKLELPENIRIRNRYAAFVKERPNWSRIS